MAEKKIRLSESLEDYLEIILDLEKTKKVARAKDIAGKMGVKRGTVSGALKSLEEKGLINYKPYSFITLTKKGAKIANEIARRHAVLKDFLFRVLQIDAEKSDAVACRMEHAMDKSSIDMLVRFIEFIDTCPRAGADWVQAFVDCCSTDKLNWEKCKNCFQKGKVRFKKSKDRG